MNYETATYAELKAITLRAIKAKDNATLTKVKEEAQRRQAQQLATGNNDPRLIKVGDRLNQIKKF